MVGCPVVRNPSTAALPAGPSYPRDTLNFSTFDPDFEVAEEGWITLETTVAGDTIAATIE